MFNDIQTHFKQRTASTEHRTGDSRNVYFDLLNESDTDQSLAAARRYLEGKLQEAARLTSDLPDTPHALSSWIEQTTAQVGRQYSEYLAARQAGAGRRYFSNKSHALYFLRSVAPTKLVDGAWLYGLVQRWNDARFSSLIKIYLEELGEGVPDKNHVLIYKKLLASHGCEQWDNLSDDHYVQGAIQLTLAHHAGTLLPETIGFNLGYEQLPLHLLITAYELNELGIDPYYFTLHVTVDNAGTGHAKKSLDGLLDALPRVGDANAFYRRVINGYKLNMLGASTVSVIGSFDLQAELIDILGRKGAVGMHLHSDYCRVSGRTVNDWLSDPAQIPAFLDNLEQRGWIKRHEDPQNSRFWKLIQGERAEMFGVFNAYEQQVIYDWIAGDLGQCLDGKARGNDVRQRSLTFKARQRLLDTLGSYADESHDGAAKREATQRRARHTDIGGERNDFDQELGMLEQKLAAMANKDDAMDLLAELMSPANHHTPPGLMATRIFSRMFG
jgi:hypothetical protein